MPESQKLIYVVTNLCLENEKLAPLRDTLSKINKSYEKDFENIEDTEFTLPFPNILKF